MKKLILMLMLLVVSTGCLPEAESYQKFGGEVALLTAKLDGLQDGADDLAALLEKGGIVDEEIVAKVDKLNEEIDRAQPDVAKAAEAVRDAPYTGDGVQDLLTAVQAVNAASAPYNPYAIPIAGVLAVVSPILGFFLRKKSIQLAKTNEAISKFEGTETPDVAARLHDIVKVKTSNT